MIVLIHSSKTMRPAPDGAMPLDKPILLDKATEISNYMKTLSKKDLSKAMKISDKLAETTYELIQSWTADTSKQRAAVDSFLGDIYSGLQVSSWTQEDRQYSNNHLRILSGLYGILSPNDGIYPYRLEMGYKLPGKQFANLYNFWGESIVKSIPKDELLVNLSAVEYSKVITKYVDPDLITTPTFLTVSPKIGEPTFVAVHAKIARGAFANWIIKSRFKDFKNLVSFTDLGYRYDAELSEDGRPVFVCNNFEGLGLSVRLS